MNDELDVVIAREAKPGDDPVGETVDLPHERNLAAHQRSLPDLSRNKRHFDAHGRFYQS